MSLGRIRFCSMIWKEWKRRHVDRVVVRLLLRRRSIGLLFEGAGGLRGGRIASSSLLLLLFLFFCTTITYGCTADEDYESYCRSMRRRQAACRRRAADSERIHFLERIRTPRTPFSFSSVKNLFGAKVSSKDTFRIGVNPHLSSLDIILSLFHYFLAVKSSKWTARKHHPRRSRGLSSMMRGIFSYTNNRE